MSAVPSTNGAHPAPADPRRALPARELDPIMLGQIMARSGLFPDIDRASQAVVKILAGRELGIGPFAAMSDIHLVDGSPVVGARILAALVRQSDVYDYRVVEWSNERVAIDFYRHGEKLEPTVTFTDEDAERAGLNQPTRSGKPSNHMKFPRNMKFARAMSNGVGLHCPDLTAGTPVYTPDELGLEDPDADVGPPPRSRRADERAGGRGPGSRGATSTCGPHRRRARGRLRGGDGRRAVPLLLRPAAPGRADRRRRRVEMAGRLRLARLQGIADERLRRMAAKGLAMDDRPRAREAADLWLTFRAADGGSEADPA